MLYLHWMSRRRFSGLFCALACCLALLTTTAKAQYAANADRWATQDALDPIPGGGIVFMGSSSIRRWEQLQYDFADYNLVQRGLGGATFATYMPTINETVLAYNPHAVVTWLGTNDIAFGGTGSGVVSDYANFISTVRNTQPDAEFYFIGITPTPGREANRPQEDIANAGVASIAANDAKVHYIDIPTAFDNLGAYTGPNYLNKFVDSLHLNRDGYDVWTSLIRPAIAADLVPDKVYTPNAMTLQQGERLLFDLGPSNNGANGVHTVGPDARGNHWNNWHDIGINERILPGEHIGNLVDTDGNNTGIGITLTSEFKTNGIDQGGLEDPDANLLGDLAAGSATIDYFFSVADNVYDINNDDIGGGFKITGLDRDREYTLKLFGTCDWEGVTRETDYKILGDSEWEQSLLTSGTDIGHDGIYDGNDDTIATFEGLRTNEFGELFVDLTAQPGRLAYLNAMELTAGDVVSMPEPTTVSLSLLAFSALVAKRCHRMQG